MRDPGEMRHRIALEAPVASRDAAGGAVTNFVPLRTVPARKLTERGVEAFAANVTLGKVEIGFAIRWWPGWPLDARHRFIFQGRIFNIVSAIESEHQVEIVVLGVAGSNSG